MDECKHILITKAQWTDGRKSYRLTFCLSSEGCLYPSKLCVYKYQEEIKDNAIPQEEIGIEHR